MKVDLAGQVALLVMNDGTLAQTTSAALAENSALVSRGDTSASRSGAVVDQLLKAFGRLDILIFVSPTVGRRVAEDRHQTGGFETAFAEPVVTFEAYSRAASDALGRSGGRIVAIGSVLGLLPARRQSLDGITDASLFHFVRVQAMQLGGKGVRVNALALGEISGDEPGSDFSTRAPELLSHSAGRRPGTLQEVAEAMLFLVDPENSSMTGHILPVDGGFTVGFARDF